MISGMSLERVQWHLDNWAEWMDGLRVGSGFRTRASGGLIGYGSSDFDSMCDAADARCAQAVDAAIDDLPHTQRLAVHHTLLGSLLRMRVLDIGDLYCVAKMRLCRVLPAKGIC